MFAHGRLSLAAALVAGLFTCVLASSTFGHDWLEHGDEHGDQHDGELCLVCVVGQSDSAPDPTVDVDPARIQDLVQPLIAPQAPDFDVPAPRPPARAPPASRV